MRNLVKNIFGPFGTKVDFPLVILGCPIGNPYKKHDLYLSDGSNWKKNNRVNHGLPVVNILTWFLVNKKLQDLFCDVPKPARFSFSNLKTILFNINPVVQGQIRILKQSKNKENASVSVVDWSQYCCFMYRYRPLVEASPGSMDSSHLSLTYKVLRTVQLFCLWVVFVSFY